MNAIVERDRFTAERIAGLVNAQDGWIDRSIFWDQGLYELELQRVFARCWLVIGHESQFEQPGDFRVTSMGEDSVIVVRQRDGSLRAFINSCPHRGNKVCHADVGRARGFICNYHGWSFGIDGSLRGVHESAAYDRCPSYDKSRQGLTPVARIATYKGMVFATFDAQAPALEDYLGDFRWYLDVVLDNDDGGTEALPGVTKCVMRCNWKFAAENFVGDALHAGWTHQAGAMAMLGEPVAQLSTDEESYAVHANGHGIEFNLDGVGNAATFGDPAVRRYLRDRQAVVARRLGEVRAKMVGSIASANVFPNFSYLPGQMTFRSWHPRGPHRTEMHAWVLVNRNMPPEIKAAYRKGVMMTFSPAGVFEMDDGENWEGSTRMNAGAVTRRRPLHYGLGIDTALAGTGFPGHVYQYQTNDANQRAFYTRWAELMTAPHAND
jgi:ethylbenzene dioxygenase alpha subunit